MNLEEKLYTSTEVAQILGVSLRSVYRYLEEGKLDAEVKTATGRHRFTRQNILDFLYPNKDNTTQNTQNNTEQQLTQAAKPVAKPKIKEEPIKKPAVVETEEDDEPEVEEEPVDWLAKFREAASKFKTEETTTAPATSTYTNTNVETETVADLSEPAPAPAPAKAAQTRFFYRSMLGGLKDIAQNIDKSARKASVDYAFTLNAGLSLHKPIKPFSILHVYVRPNDKDLFEKMLQLVPSESDTAQVCLILSEKSSIYDGKKELHGLYVVSNIQLKADLLEAGDEELSRELDQDFPF